MSKVLAGDIVPNLDMKLAICALFHVPLASEPACETYLSTQQDRPQASARLPGPHGHYWRTQGFGRPPGSWPQAFVGLIRPQKPANVERPR